MQVSFLSQSILSNLYYKNTKFMFNFKYVGVRKDKDNFNRSLMTVSGIRKCSLALQVQKHENPKLCHTKYRGQQGINYLLDLVWLQYLSIAG